MAYDIPHHIQQLLTLFMEGDSTLEQEEELARFFRTHQVSRQWKPYQQMFAYFDSGMDGNAASTPAKNKPRIRFFWRAAAAAAVIAAILALTITLLHTQHNNAIPQQPSIAENTNDKSTVDEQDTIKAEIIPTDTASTSAAEQPLIASNSKKMINKAHLAKATRSKLKDSIEIVHTQAALEVAEQEILADRLLLEEELQQTQHQRPANNAQSGWVNTSLNIQ